jgi:L-histidine N-alpha-methyltransferase
MVARARSVDVRVVTSQVEQRRLLVDEARAGLLTRPRQLSPKWFYDERGCALFDEITRLPEYYLTRCEREILEQRSAEIAGLTRARTLIELGSGTSEKTRLLLDALTKEGPLQHFVPFDVSEPTLEASGAAIRGEYPGLGVEPIAGDFERHLGHLPEGTRKLVAFLGSTIGNLPPDARRDFLEQVGRLLGPMDALLLGIDLVKDESRLLAAYDDAAGVTAEFNRNVLRVLNRELGASFVPERFEHDPLWDAENEWIEMRLRATQAESVPVQALDAVVELDEGETIRTEISQKFRAERIAAELADVGLHVAETWRDGHGDFALVLAFGSE